MVKFMATEAKWWLLGGVGVVQEAWQFLFNRHTKFQSGKMRKFERWMVVMVVSHCEYT
jgi:hypothetical protein